MKNLIFFIIVIYVSVILISFIFPKEEATVCINKKCVFVEIADTQLKRSEGLMFRESLENDKGMLFVFEKPGIYNFWMKNTYIPLDIIWIYDNQIIHFITAQPCFDENCTSFGPNNLSELVLEVNSGFVEKNNIKIGDPIIFKN